MTRRCLLARPAPCRRGCALSGASFNAPAQPGRAPTCAVVLQACCPMPFGACGSVVARPWCGPLCACWVLCPPSTDSPARPPATPRHPPHGMVWRGTARRGMAPLRHPLARRVGPPPRLTVRDGGHDAVADPRRPVDKPPSPPPRSVEPGLPPSADCVLAAPPPRLASPRWVGQGVAKHAQSRPTILNRHSGPSLACSRVARTPTLIPCN